MKATELLEKQHREVEELFESLESDSAEGKADIVEELATNLAAHAVMEEELFYPVAKRFKRELVFEAHEEHELMAHALKRLVAGKPEAESFKAKVKACKELVEHHVEEEENDLFPAVDDGLQQEENEALGARMEARFGELVQSGYEEILAARKAKRNGHAADKTKKMSQAPRREA